MLLRILLNPGPRSRGQEGEAQQPSDHHFKLLIRIHDKYCKWQDEAVRRSTAFDKASLQVCIARDSGCVGCSAVALRTPASQGSARQLGLADLNGFWTQLCRTGRSHSQPIEAALSERLYLLVLARLSRPPSAVFADERMNEREQTIIPEL